MSYLRAGAALIAAFLLQTMFAPLVLAGGWAGGLAAGVTPDFFLATAAAVALLAGPGPAIGFGLFAGLLQDSFSGGLLGMNGFSKPLVVFAVARAREQPPLAAGFGVPVLLLFAAIPARELGAAGFGIPVTVAYGILVFRFLRRKRPDYDVA